MKWNSSLKNKLILWNALVVMLIYAIAASMIYFFVKNRLNSVVQDKLEEQLNVVSTVVYTSGGDYYDWYHLGDQQPFLIMEDEQYAYHTAAWQQLGMPQVLASDEFDHNNETMRMIDDRHFRFKMQHVTTGIDTMHNFQVVLAMDDTDTYESIDGLAAKLSSGIYFILLLALIGGNFLANRALAPIKKVTEKAKAISAQSLSERLPVINSKDEIGELTQVLNELLERLDHSFQRLQQFTADASHEFRTPLTAMRTIGQVALVNAKEKNTYREAISSMLEEIERMTDLVNNLLILTRHDARSVASFEKTDLSPFIQTIIDELQILADEKLIDITFEKSEAVFANLNKQSMRQALTNVLHNAIQHAPQQSTITITLRVSPLKNIIIDITDSGSGIPIDKRDQVFERFYRIDDARSSKDGGAGLGLAIAKSAVELNKGSIEFIDTEQSGACCRISLQA